MTFGEFWKLYTEDVEPRVKLNTWLTKENIVEKKIFPYFKNLKMNEITPADVRKWQNEMLALTDTDGKSYSQTYRKTIKTQLKKRDYRNTIKEEVTGTSSASDFLKKIIGSKL